MLATARPEMHNSRRGKSKQKQHKSESKFFFRISEKKGRRMNADDGTRIWKGVEGMRDKFNDIVLSNTSQDTSNCQRLYIFFGGDVQNFEKEMVAHRDHGSYRNYRCVINI